MGILDSLFGRKRREKKFKTEVENASDEKVVIEKPLSEKVKELLSTDYGYKEAVEKIKGMSTNEDVNSFTKGDERRTVIKAAESRIKALNSPSKPKKKKTTTPGR